MLFTVIRKFSTKKLLNPLKLDFVLEITALP
jgi:hypothetical protein